MCAIVSGCSDAPAAPPSDSPPDSEATTWIQTNLLHPQCAQCHWKVDPYAKLDLYSPGLEARVVGRGASECSNAILVVPGNPDGSYLLRKIVDIAPRCGSRMPIGQNLSEEWVQWVRDWIASLDDTAPSQEGG